MHSLLIVNAWITFLVHFGTDKVVKFYTVSLYLKKLSCFATDVLNSPIFVRYKIFFAISRDYLALFSVHFVANIYTCNEMERIDFFFSILIIIFSVLFETIQCLSNFLIFTISFWAGLMEPLLEAILIKKNMCAQHTKASKLMVTCTYASMCVWINPHTNTRQTTMQI